MKKIAFGIIIGAILCFSLNVVADTVITSKSISYSNSKTEETTVDGALNDLFSAVDLNEEMVVIKEQISELQSSCNAKTSINEVYPVGSIYISTSKTNPSTLFNGTTWEIYGENRMLLGVGTSSSSGQTGGSNTVTLSINNLPSHTHSIPALSGTAASTGNGYTIGHTYASRTSASTGSGYSITHGSATRTTSNTGAHTHDIYVDGTRLWYNVIAESTAGYNSGIMASAGPGTFYAGSAGAHTHTVADYYATGISGVAAHTHNYNDYYANSISGVQAHTHNVSTTASTTGSTGSTAAVNIQNPYITVYMWKRTK